MSDRDLHEDTELRKLLQQHAPAPPADDVNWSALHARITDDAAPRLRRRAPTLWWHQVAGWSARGIPLGAAAAATLALVIGTGIVEPRSTDRAPASPSFLTLEEELAAGTAVLLAAGDDADAVMEALLFYDMEE